MAFDFQFVVLKLVASTISIMPKWLIRMLLPILSRLVSLFWSKDRRLLQKNVTAVYGLASHSRFMKMFERQVLDHQLAASFETISNAVSSQTRVELEGLEQTHEAVTESLRAGKGLIVVTAHLGSWELVASSVAKGAGVPFNALAKPSKNSAFTKFLDALRAKMNIRVLWTDSKNLLRDMLGVLKKGECLGFVMDQKPEGRIGHKVDFLGRKTAFVSGPAKIASRSQTPILAIFCLRQGPWRYRLIAESINMSEQDSELELTQKMATVMEKYIKLYPEQWLWNYKRWRLDQT